MRCALNRQGSDVDHKLLMNLAITEYAAAHCQQPQQQAAYAESAVQYQAQHSVGEQYQAAPPEEAMAGRGAAQELAPPPEAAGQQHHFEENKVGGRAAPGSQARGYSRGVY